MTILIVDDQEINRDVLGMILEDDYDIIYACDGREALQKIEEYKDSLSVVLIDLIMPVMDGFQVLSEIRDSEELKQIPVIFPNAISGLSYLHLQISIAVRSSPTENVLSHFLILFLPCSVIVTL